MANRKPLPMPVEMVLMSRHLLCQSSVVERAIAIVTMRYWAAGCPPGAAAEREVRDIARMDGQTWKRAKTPLMAALADLLPELARQYDIAHSAKERMRAMLSANASKGRIILNKKKQDKIVDGAIQKPHTPPLVTPSRKPAYVDNAAALKPTETATINRKKQGVALLRD